jgi:hypothetical protein
MRSHHKALLGALKTGSVTSSLRVRLAKQAWDQNENAQRPTIRDLFVDQNCIESDQCRTLAADLIK